MKVVKVINNNLVHTCDDNLVDCIVMGCGLGFKKKPGDEIDASKVEKIYKISDPVRSSQFTQLVKDIPLEHLQVANMIIDYAISSLNRKLSDNIYLSLIDHIDFALERLEKGIPLKNKLLDETKRIYFSEYLVGLEALNIVNRELNVNLPEDEAGYIAIHLVEAEVDTENSQYVTQSLTMIRAILEMIANHFHLELNTNSLAYERLLVHLRFFADRVIQHVSTNQSDEKFIAMMKLNFKEEYACGLKIRAYINEQFNYEVSDDELIYISVHIHRVLTELNK